MLRVDDSKGLLEFVAACGGERERFVFVGDLRKIVKAIALLPKNAN